jgi:TrmH family RNA methyltransferase
MIPLFKLKSLPRSQRLRKAASLVRNAEHRLIVSGFLPRGELEYFFSFFELLIEDEALPLEAKNAFKAMPAVFSPNAIKSGAGGISGELHGGIRRALNTAFHILTTETGRTQADWDFIEINGVLDASKRQPFAGMQVYLEDIRSPFNVGSMFRAADSFGTEKIWLSPLCADPRHKRAGRTAMGCVDVVPWERFSFDPFTLPEGLNHSSPPEKLEGEKAVPPSVSFLNGPFFALETGGTPLADFSFPPSGVLIVGSEELGVSPHALAAADKSLGRVSIPMRGAKGWLNASVAFGIVMQAWAEKIAKA